VNRRIHELLLRRERILARVADQREDLGAAVAALERPAAAIDRVADGVRWLKARPAVIAALVAAVVILRRRGILTMVGRSLGLWRLARSVQGLVRHLHL